MVFSFPFSPFHFKDNLMYHAYIQETQGKPGFFTVTVRDPRLCTMESKDPEHDICHLLTEEGWEDGPVQFYRDVPSLSVKSLHKYGRKRIQLGEKFPYLEYPRQTVPEPSLGVFEDGDFEEG